MSSAQHIDASWPRDLVSIRYQPEQVVLASYERSAITLEQYAERVIAYAKSSAEVARRAAVDKRVQILRDAWGPLLKAALENWLLPEVQDLVLGKNRDQLDLSRNPAKHIWSEQSVLYKLPPKRTTPSNEHDVELYNDLVEDTGFAGFWQLVELLLNSCREVVIWPDVIQLSSGEKVIRHRCEVGNTITVIPMAEDKTIIECYLHIYEFTDLFEGRKTQYRLWTNKWHAAFEEDKSGKIQRVGYVDPSLYPEERSDPAQDNSANNPYGMMPHYHLRMVDWQDGPWDSTSGEDLVDLTIHGGKERAFYRYLQKVSGFKQGVVTGNSLDKVSEQILDPAYMAKFEGDDVKFHIVDWTIDLRARLQCMMDDELSSAAAYGINPQRYTRAGNYQTSYSAKTAERGLDEARERSIPIFEAAERAYKKSLCTIAKVHGFDSVPDPEARLEVAFQPMAYPEDPYNQMMLDKEQIAMGVKSPIDLVRRAHPEWTDKQCEKYIEENLETIAWINDMKVKHNVPNDPAAESASAEENGRMGPIVRDQGKGGKPPAGDAAGRTNSDRGSDE